MLNHQPILDNVGNSPSSIEHQNPNIWNQDLGGFPQAFGHPTPESVQGQPGKTKAFVLGDLL